MNDLIKLGSNTAKAGFKNEDDIVAKFNNWNTDKEAQEWLKIMNYKLDEIEKVIAVKLHGYKTDVQVQITIYLKSAISAENLSIKLVSNPTGFNQVDKRKVDKYIEMWNIPEKVANILKRFTGEVSPNIDNPKDPRRMFLNEFQIDEQKTIVDYFTQNKILVVSDILKGRDQFAAEWMLVALITSDTQKWVLKTINEVMNVFGNGEVRITDKGSLKIGDITMQRKGGDGGRESAKMLQFKINPVKLFD
jgi:hypothetical protein